MMSKPTILDEKEAYQAVIFIENSVSQFHPLTRQKVLLPLVNVPILAYTLKMLIRSKIQDAFVFCSQDAPEIKTFIGNSDFAKKMNIQVFVSEEYTSLGPAMRDLDSKRLIKKNFILINGDCVGNIDLDKLIELHKENIRNDPCCVMTTVFRKIYPDHTIRSVEKENTLLLLNSKQKILFYEKSSLKKSVHVPAKLCENEKVQFRFDLLDTQISICSEKVPPDFTDNFDFENREDFIHGLLAEDELLQHYIYAHVLEEGYAARVKNFETYCIISKDIMKRFLYPFVPDFDNNYSYRRYNVYLHDTVNILNKPKMMKNVVINNHTKIGFNTTIIDSVVGSNCHINDNVKIKNSFIFDNVKIGNCSTIENSIISFGVIIQENCEINSGCIISDNVIINSNQSIKKSTKLTLNFKNDELIENDELNEKFLENSDEDENYEDYSDKESTSFSDSSENSESPVEEFAAFFTEVLESLQRGIEEMLIAENLILEINSSKHAYNVPVKEVNALVIKALMQLALNEKGKFFTNLKSNLAYSLPIIENYIRNVDSQNDCLYSIEEFFLSNKDKVSFIELVKTIEFLYESNIIDEDIILNWYHHPENLPDHEVNEQTSLRKSKEIMLFIKWLEEAEEESNDEE